MKENVGAGLQPVRAVLAAAYGVDGALRTVVRGVNWTLAAETSDGRTLFVRLYRTEGRPPEAIEAELAVLAAVEATPALGVSRPLADRRGRLAVPVAMDGHGRRMLAVFEAAPGRPLARTGEDLAAAGRALADLHAQASLAELAPRRPVVDEEAIAQTVARMAAHSDAGREAAQAIASALEALRRLGADRSMGPIGFCHGDFRDANMRLAGERVTLFDFDDCGLGPQWLDLATMGWWIEQGDPEAAPGLWRAFVEGYGEPADREAFGLAVRWLVAVQHLRSVRFLLDYCALPEDLWAETFASAVAMLERAAAGLLELQRTV